MNYKSLKNTLAGAMVLTAGGSIYELSSVMSTTVETLKTEEKLERRISRLEGELTETTPEKDISTPKIESAVLGSDIEFEASELESSKRRTFNGLYVGTGLILAFMVCGKGVEYANKKLYSSKS